MARRIGDLLDKQRSASFVGRSRELTQLLSCLTAGGYAVALVHGIGGIGKSSLLRRFAVEAAETGARVIDLDGRNMEPTERGFFDAICRETGISASESTVDDLAAAISALGKQVILLIDNYEHIFLIDAWIRQKLAPALETNVHLVFAGRQAPLPGWRLAPEWQDLFLTIPLDILGDNEAQDLLVQAGLSREQAARINRVARGHPLALRLAAAARSGPNVGPLEDKAYQSLVSGFADLHLSQIEDAGLREALEAGCVVRRTTVPLLAAMLPDRDATALYAQLRDLPVVESALDGLIVHAAVQEAVASSLRAADPERYRNYRQAAWRELRSEYHRAGINEMWRYTADMLFILDNPLVREVFFPTGLDGISAEKAGDSDIGGLRALAARFETSTALQLLEHWWHECPDVFYVTRSEAEPLLGFFLLLEHHRLDRQLLDADPLTKAWQQHLRENPIPRDQTAIFCRRWLSTDHGEGFSSTQSMAWLQTKQRYMALRPQLRRCYISVTDLETYGPTAQSLGFKPVAAVDLDGVTHHLAFLDFGADSVDGWITGNVAKELGLDDTGLLDVNARELVLDGQRLPLTPLEFEFMRFMTSHRGDAVSRATLMEAVWGYDFSGESNVVDTLVAGLRRKLKHASVQLETVWGVGYKLK